ncbi:MAG TPA: hypothetical protein VE046_10725 [Steroidobacteraceae bacterium]|nr:hypothetical protein [Steroidobacteraceae bacterium]
MKIKMGLMCLVAALSVLFAGTASATTLRVIVVQTTDVAGYVKSLQEGQAVLKAKGGTGTIRAWVATFAGSEAGSVIVSVEYPSLEALAKDTAMMKSDAELKAWMQKLGTMRKIVSDSIYEELK